MKATFNKRSSILGAFFLSLAALGQQAPSNPPAEPVPVTVPFFVLDHNNHTVTDVQQSDLTILDNKKPGPSILSVKKGSEAPLRVGLMIDASNSQRKSSLYQPLVRAASDLLNQILSGPDDKVAVFKVSDDLWPSPLMNKHELMTYKIDLTPRGATALYDGIASASDQLTKVDTPSLTRRVLIVLSDGDDNISQIPRDTAIAKALEAGVVIFCLSTSDDSSAPYIHGARGDSTLEHLAEETGGEAFLHLNRKKIEQSFSVIAEAISNMYFVTFDSANVGEKGLHRIELKISGKDKIRLRAPKGYQHR